MTIRALVQAPSRRSDETMRRRCRQDLFAASHATASSAHARAAPAQPQPRASWGTKSAEVSIRQISPPWW